MSIDRAVSLIESGPELRDHLAELFASTEISVLSFVGVPQFLAAYDRRGTGCIVLDASTTRNNCFEIQRALASAGVESPRIVLVARGVVPAAVLAMKAGASDALEIPFTEEVVLNKVQGCLALAQQPPRTAPHDVNVLGSLTPRERQVLDLVVIGKASKRIAYELHISVKTVEKHRENVMRKMGAENVADLVRIVLSS